MEVSHEPRSSSLPRLKVLYLLAVTVAAFVAPAWDVTAPYRWYIVGALALLQVCILLGARVPLLEIVRAPWRLKWLFIFLLAAYTFMPEEQTTSGFTFHLSSGTYFLPTSMAGFYTALLMCLQITTVILVSAVVRLTGSGTDLVDGLRSFHLPALFVYSIDYTLALLGGIRRRGMGGGGGQGTGGGKGRHREMEQAQAAAAPGPGFFAVLKRMLGGDVGFLAQAVRQSLDRARMHVEIETRGALDARLTHDIAVVTGIALMMMSLKILKFLPGLPFFSGHKTLLLYPLYILAAELTHSRWGGTVCGTIMGIIGFMQGDGRYGAMEILKHAVPGFVVDLVWPLVRKFPRSAMIYCVLGLMTAIARTTTEFATVLLLGGKAEVYLFPAAKLIPNVIAGTLSGFITFFILGAFNREQEQGGTVVEGAPPADASPVVVSPAPGPGSGMGGGGGRGMGGGGGRGGGQGRNR